MTAQTYQWKAGDTGPTNPTTLVDRDGTPANLAGATVRFVMRPTPHASPVKIAAAAAVDDAAGGIVHYERQAADTDTPGVFHAEYEVTYSSGRVQTYPESGYITVHISDDLD